MVEIAKLNSNQVSLDLHVKETQSVHRLCQSLRKCSLSQQLITILEAEMQSMEPQITQLSKELYQFERQLSVLEPLCDSVAEQYHFLQSQLSNVSQELTNYGLSGPEKSKFQFIVQYYRRYIPENESLLLERLKWEFSSVKILYPLIFKEAHFKARLKQIHDLQKHAKIQQAKQEQLKMRALEQEQIAKLKWIEYDQFYQKNEQKKQHVSEWKKKMALEAKAARYQKRTLLEFAKMQKKEKEALLQQQRLEMKQKIQEWKTKHEIIPIIPEPSIPVPIEIQERIMERQEKMIQRQIMAKKPVPIELPLIPKKPGRGDWNRILAPKREFSTPEVNATPVLLIPKEDMRAKLSLFFHEHGIDLSSNQSARNVLLSLAEQAKVNVPKDFQSQVVL